ncbi:MAG: KpsF/GutQ family sugar-phosphate isomerase [Alphaproteobacteria bacterium]|nr:KpsF/GutQ family sugar-phosphate isomerase [Alphaproteobacteria bacterium]
MMTSENQDISSAKRTIDKEVETLRIMEDELGNNDNLSKALDLMQNTKGRVIVTGMGKSGHIGHKIAATLASTGTPAFFVHPGEASHGDLGMLTNDDVVLAISNGGESKELSDIIVYCKRYGIPLISMTKNPDSSLGRAGDVLLKLPDHGEACPLGLAPTSSTTATLVLGDILAVCLLERKGFSKLDYKQRHPGGKLGAILQKVSDLMHTGKEMPLINKDATMKEALLEMTAKMLGSVGIVDTDGKLIGMITDGDLRRCMSDNILSKNVAEIMTKNPKTTTPDILASELLKILNENKITQMFVIDNGMPVGIIHIHDCFNAGVA